jgi:hypothetical protein
VWPSRAAGAKSVCARGANSGAAAGRSTRALDIAVDMQHFRPLALISALALAITSAIAVDLSGYSVVKLHSGLNNLDMSFAGQHVSVVIGHRENFNAHSFDVVTFYLSNGDPTKGLDIVGVWDKDKESLTTHVSGGADCLLHDFRLLRSAHGDPPMLLIADRPELRTFVDPEIVSFEFYSLKQSTERNLGEPRYWFDLIGTQTSKSAYCDVGLALLKEFGIIDYRSSPRPDGYWNSPGAMSNNRWRGP